MKIINEMKLEFMGVPENEGFARVAVSAFAVQLDPTLDVLADIKTAVSEAVTNAIVHGYQRESGMIYIDVKLTDENNVIIKIRDKGVGIEDIKQAMQPLFTTAESEERAGLGFAVMQSFTDNVKVTSAPQKGTTVTLKKRIIPLK